MNPSAQAETNRVSQFRRRRRRIIYDSRVERILDREMEAHTRLYELMRFFEWLLERSPATDHATRMPPPNEDIWLIKTEGIPGVDVPDATLQYTFDDETVTFINIRIEAA